MTMFAKRSVANVDLDKAVSEGAEFQRIPTGVHKGVVTAMYVLKKYGKFVIELKMMLNGNAEYKQTFYVADNDNPESVVSNEGKYSRDGSVLNALLSAIDPSKPTIDDENIEIKELPQEVYNPETKVNDEVACSSYVHVLQKPVLVAMKHIRKNKNVMNEATGKWEATSEVKEENKIHMFFNAEGFSPAEVRTGAAEAKVMGDFKAKYGNNVIDQYKEVANSGNVGATNAAVSAVMGGNSNSLDDDDI